ncbi:MAG: HEAT repeat domain-containing protein [Planctomycetota bacterium]
MTDDRELRQKIAAEAQTGSPLEAGPGVRAFQFFLVPLLIVVVCVAGVVGVTYLGSHPRPAAEWIKDIRDGGPNTRAHAALQLAQALRRMENPDPSLTDPLLEIYRSSRPEETELRRYLAHCLGTLRDPRAAGFLLERVRQEADVEVRAACLDALGAIKDPETLPELVKLLDDPDGVVRKYAAFNVGAVAERALDRSGAVQALRRKLSDPRPDVGWNAALALAYFLEDGSGADTLKKMLDRAYLREAIDPKDPNAEILAARAIVGACNAAARLRDPGFVPLLRRLADDRTESDPDVRFVAHQAIRKIESR